MTLPESIFPVRLNAALGWPRAMLNEAVRRIWQCETSQDLRDATEFIQSVAQEMDEAFLRIVRSEWSRTKQAIDAHEEHLRMVRDVYT